MGTTVTIDKSYFETLLRRVEFHVSGQDFVTPLDLSTVHIPKIDHENLLRMAHEYMRLRDALHHGGVNPQTLEVLIRGEHAPGTTPTYATDINGTGNTRRIDPSSAKQPGTSFEFGQVTRTAPKNPWMGQDSHLHRPSSPSNDDAYFPNDVEKYGNGSPYNLKTDRSLYPRMERMDQRSIVLKNLSDRTTHQQVVNKVRGGPLLDVYLRSQDKSAIVSFIHGSSAQEFFAYLKRNDIYIHSRRVSFAWAERQYILPGHLANKICVGATRNLVIRGVQPNITEKLLRDDLDHIHNLIIISVSFDKGDAYLSLNSVRNSLFARTCMMSRAMYKGMKIEWYPDECALPLPNLQNDNKKEPSPPKAKEMQMINRFQMLDMDDDNTEGGSSLAEDDDPTLSSGFTPLQTSRRTPWNLPTVVA